MRIDNSQVVREVDPRSSRDLWWLLVVFMALAGGLGIYAWPHLELRETSRAQERLARERDRLVEENRKLRLEKASLENLRRVESIAVKDLGLEPPPAGRVIVVETPRAPLQGGQVAREMGPPEAAVPVGHQ